MGNQPSNDDMARVAAGKAKLLVHECHRPVCWLCSVSETLAQLGDVSTQAYDSGREDGERAGYNLGCIKGSKERYSLILSHVRAMRADAERDTRGRRREREQKIATLDMVLAHLERTS